MQSTVARSVIRLLITAALILVTVHGALAQRESLIHAANVTMTVDFGYDGLFRPGYWTPVQATIVNTGPPFEASLQVIARHGSPIPLLSRTTAYTQDLYLATNVPVTAQVYPLISNAYHPLHVELRDKAGHVLAQTSIDLQRRSVDGHIVVALDPTGAEWSWLAEQVGTTVGTRGQRLGLQLAYMRTPQQLPYSWIGYHGVTAVAISGSFPMTALSEAQREALSTWVESGGRLIWAGGLRTESARSPLAHSHSPLNPSGLTQRLVPGEPIPHYPAFPAGLDVIVWKGEIASGTVLAAADGVPLIARRRLGQGEAFLVAFDPHTLHRAGWTGLGRLAREAMLGAAPLEANLGAAEEGVWEFVRSTRLPAATRTLAGVIGMSFVVVIGLSLWWLRGKNASALITGIGVAILSVAVALAVYVSLAPAITRNRHAVSLVTVTATDSTGYGLRWWYHGLRSWDEDLWVIRGAPIGWTPQPTTLLTTVEGEPEVVVAPGPEMTSVRLEKGTLGRFKAIEPAHLPLTGSLTLQAKTYRVQVTNGLDHTVRFMYYVTPYTYMYLGDAVPGSTTTRSYPADVHAGARPSPEWLGGAVASHLRSSAEHPDLNRLASLVNVLVTERLRTGANLSSLDDGFIIGLIDGITGVGFSPNATTEMTHVVMVNMRLEGTQ